MLTADEYFHYTNILAPADFDSCVEIATQQIHGATMYAYWGRDMESMPESIQHAWKQAIALQTCAVSQNGGIAGLSQHPQTSMSLGKFSYTGSGATASTVALSPAVRVVLPLLVSYGRGLRPCCLSR